MLNPRAIAVGGVGYGPLPMAMLGLWAVGEEVVAIGAAWYPAPEREKPTSRKRRRDEEALFIALLM